jgi:hypothetical protein
MIASFLSPSYIYFLSYNTVPINTFHSPIFFSSRDVVSLAIAQALGGLLAMMMSEPSPICYTLFFLSKFVIAMIFLQSLYIYIYKCYLQTKKYLLFEKHSY